MFPSIKVGFLSFSTFQICSLISFSLCCSVFLFSKKYDKLFIQNVISAILPCSISAVLCGKILYSFSAIIARKPFGINWISGFVFFGGFWGAYLGLYIYCKKNNLYFFDYSDILCSLLPLGQAIGRIGCFCNGCCYGIQTESVLSVKYRINGELVRVFPTWFVESIYCVLLFLLFFIISNSKKSGFYTGTYMIYYSFCRFILEFYRGDSIRGVWGGISTSQIICVITFMIGIILMIRLSKSFKQNIIVGRKP